MKNIVLIGMPGCGKSTVGVILAKSMGTRFIDTDLVIQERENALLQEIIDQRGLEAFLKAEEAAVLSTACRQSVIATGGSVVYSDAAMRHLKKDGIAVYLKLPFEEIMRRLSNIKTRGIAVGAGKSMEDVYQERIPLYEKYADIVIDGSSLNAEEEVTAIVSQVKSLSYQDEAVDFVERSAVVELANPGCIYRQLLTPETAPGTGVSLTEMHVLPGYLNHRHYHTESEQIWHAISGSGVLLLDEDTELPFSAGDTVRFEPGRVHGLRNDSGEEFVYLAATTPPVINADAYLYEE